MTVPSTLVPCFQSWPGEIFHLVLRLLHQGCLEIDPGGWRGNEVLCSFLPQQFESSLASALLCLGNSLPSFSQELFYRRNIRTPGCGFNYCHVRYKHGIFHQLSDLLSIKNFCFNFLITCSRKSVADRSGVRRKF